MKEVEIALNPGKNCETPKIKEMCFKFSGDEAVVSMSDRKRLPYTCAFIEEVYRFRTLLPLSVAHKTTEDVHLRGFLIPKETKVSSLFRIFNQKLLKPIN